MKYFTENNKDVTLLVEDNMTIIYDTYQEAYKQARLKRSYPYPIFKEGKDRKRVAAGYAVSK